MDERLSHFFAEARARAESLSPEGPALVGAIAELTLRGGKRVRPLLLVAGYAAVAEQRPRTDVLEAAAALELFQSYLLIHDDWMDGDPIRRGGPAVHAAFESQHRDPHLAASLAILAGNYASALSWELLTSAPWTADTKARAIAIFHRMHREVVCGQQLDLLTHRDVERMQQLKTGSYTVRGPLELACALGGASDSQQRALLAYGEPLGRAFQMRDDLLGAFGDPACTGKPNGGDFRQGRRTSLVRAAEEHARGPERDELLALLHAPLCSSDELTRTRTLLITCGAREAVEAQLDALGGEAVRAIAGSSEGGRTLSSAGRSMLQELAEQLTRRDR